MWGKWENVEPCLLGLATLAIHKDFPIDLEKVIDIFAEKARKLQF